MKLPVTRFRIPLVAFLIGSIATYSSTVAYAGSFALNEQSVSGLGTAFAGGAASAEDSSTIFFNPAGIALLDHGELQAGAHALLPSAQFHNEGSRIVAPGLFNGEPLTGGNSGNSPVYHAIPNVYFSQPVFRGPHYGDLTVGVGLSVPFGLETDYSPGWVGRYFALRSKLSTFDIQPSIAYRLWDRLSLGASVDIQYASARLSQAVDYGAIGGQVLASTFFPNVPLPFRAAVANAYANSGFVPQGRDGVTELHGDDWSVGFTVGGVFEYLKGDDTSVFQDGRFGVSYRSGITHDIDGTAEFRGVPTLTAAGLPAILQFPQPNALRNTFFTQSVKARLDLPEIYHFSVYQRFLRKFAVMGDINWTRWSRLQSLPITFSNPGTPGQALNLGYDDSRRYSVGFEWYATQNFTFRLGFAYDETPIKNDSFRDPRIPDNDRYTVAVGFQWRPIRNVAFDFGYNHLFVDDPTVNITDNIGGVPVHNLRGKFDASVDIVSASVTYSWGGPREAPAQPTTEGKGVGKGYVK
jgi:long-chain fatty acid transport protein